LAAGVRFVSTTSRLTILIERQSGRPFPRRYYGGGVPVLDTPEIEPGQLTDRTRFLRVFTAAPYRPDVLREIEQSPDRAELNLPDQLRNLRQEGIRDGFLPSYLVETADHRILAYTAVAEARDEFLEGLCTETSIENLIEAKRIRPPREVWSEWLAGSTAYGDGRVAESGIATLPEVTSVRELEVRIHRLADGLRVSEVSVAELRAHARASGDDRRLDRLISLGDQAQV
jgi:hypothetical protein